MVFMKAFVVINFMGAFAFDEKGKLIEQRLFPAKPDKIAKRLHDKELGGAVKEELELIESLGKSGYTEISGKKSTDFDFREFALENKWAKSDAELNRILSKANVLLTKGKISVVKSDRVLMHVVGVVDETDRFLNTLSERLREWYGLFSGNTQADSNEKFAEIAAGSKEREISDFANALKQLYSVRKRLGTYLESIGKEAAPNLSAIAGPFLAARLLELAGGLDRLAKMSSSKIQLLGAEKALFRHLRGMGKSPKYGIIFSHPHVQSAPRERKGKVARLVAAKLSLAARVDFFSKEDRSAEMKKELDRQVRGLGGPSAPKP